MCIYAQSLLYVTVSFTCLFVGFSYGEYNPNYGFVGCYWYTNHMELFAEFNRSRDVISPLTMHSCVQSCMKRKWKYAGLMAGRRCYCGMSYNQTFAVDQKHCDTKCGHGIFSQPCGGTKHMTIYNTDYDVKPLLSIPGNNTNFVEIWNRPLVEELGMFADDILSNSAINWWDEKKLDYTPEYVSVVLYSRLGQPLWSIEFFTNDTNSASLDEWMTKDRILPNKYFNTTMKNRAQISRSEEKVKIHNGDKVWFAHGGLNNPEARVTVFAPYAEEQRETHTEVRSLSCSRYQDSETCRMDLVQKTGGQECECMEKHNGVCRQHQVAREEEEKATNWIDVCLNSHRRTCKDPTACTKKDVCYTYKSCNITRQYLRFRLSTTGPNYGMQRLTRLKADGSDCKNEVIQESEPFYICDIEFEDYNETSLEFEFWLNEEVNRRKIVTVDPSKNQQPCIYTQHLELKFPNSLPSSCKFWLHKPEDDALIMADRVAVLGFYHREEPKVSKWEFLNGYSIEEIKNIMRPVLQKARAATEVQVRNLSSNTRKKASATDMRTSSQGIGILGGSLLGMVFLVIFISDIFVLKAHLKMMYRNVSSYFRQSKKANQHNHDKD